MITVMYNTNLICTYNTINDADISNKIYQHELLSVFNLTCYSNQLTTYIQQLYTSLDYPIKEITQHVSFHSDDPELLFLVLFSYDYFNYTHNLICKIITKQDTTKCHEELISILKG
jgi:hypothetical protein